MDRGEKKQTKIQAGLGPAGQPLKWAGLLLMLTAVVLLVFFSFEEKAPFQPYVATVNGEKIYLAELEEKLHQEISLVKGLTPLGEDEFSRIREAVLDSILLEKIMLQRALALNVSVSNEELNQALKELQGPYSAEEFQKIVEQNKKDLPTIRAELRNRLTIDKLVDREVLSRITVSETEVRNFFVANRTKYSTNNAAWVAQIVVREKTRADRALKRLKAGEAFAVVARDISIGPEAAIGGDLGYLDAGSMPEAFDAVAFSLPVGRVSGIVKTNYGYHIIKVIDRYEGGKPDFERLKRRVLTDLKRVKQENAYRKWIADIKTEAVINIRKDVK